MINDENKIKEEVLNAIQRGDIKQHSRRYFVLRGALIGTGIGLVLVAVLYLASFIFFIMRQTGVWFVPAFGWRGWVSFFRSAPWLLIALAAAFVILLEVLVRRYSFAYREPLAYSAVGLVLIVVGGGFLLFETSVHRVLFGFAENHGLPSPVGQLYRGFGEQRFEDIHPGMIIATTSDGFILQEIHENTTDSVVIASDTQLPAESGFAPSDTVVVFGPEASGVIHAIGIQKAGSDILWVAPPAR
jgi:hypothetical protein